MKAAGVKLDKVTLRTVLQGTFSEKNLPPPLIEVLKQAPAKKTETPCIDQYFDIPMFDFDDDSIDEDDDDKGEEERNHDEQNHQQEQQQQQQQQQLQQQQHDDKRSDNNTNQGNFQLKNEMISQTFNVIEEIVNSAATSPSSSAVNRDGARSRSELDSLQGTFDPTIYLISQSIGFSVKNKFVTEETLKALLNYQAEKKKLI